MQNVVALFGGLGNQLFQLAFGQWLELRSERRTLYAVGSKPGFKELVALGPLGAHLRSRAVVIADAERRTYRMWNGESSSKALPLPERRVCRVPSPNNPTPRTALDAAEYEQPALWIGHWGEAEYVGTLLPSLATEIEDVASPNAPPFIGVSVRRGDMLRTPAAVPGHWFEPALRQLRGSLDASAAKLPATIWSDDLGWCRENLALLGADSVAPPGGPVEQLTQLSGASGMVVSRSTFSWWAAAIAATRASRPLQVVFPAPWEPSRLAPPCTDGALSWIPLEIEQAPQRAREA